MLPSEESDSVASESEEVEDGLLSEDIAARHSEYSKVRKVEEHFRISVSLSDSGEDDPLLDRLAKTSESFSLRCNPSDLRELGSGYVLFFWLVQYLGILLLMYTVVLLPVIVENINTSPWDHNHTRVRDAATGLASFMHLVGGDVDGVCQTCTGNVVDGVPYTGPQSTPLPNFGATCGAWDLEGCMAYEQQGIASVGTWCCKSWCYMSSECNRAHHSSLASGLYWDYVACDDDPNDMLQCQQRGWTNSTDFDGNPLHDDSTMEVTSWMFLTPGNLGHMLSDSRVNEYCYIVIIVLALCAATVLEQMREVIDEAVDNDATHPNDFAVLVSGFPADATNHNEIRDFFERHAIENCQLPRGSVVSVIIAWDLTAYASLMRKKEKLAQDIEQGKSDDEIQEDFDNFVKHIKMQTGHNKPTSSTFAVSSESGCLLSCSGFAVVVFDTQDRHRACLRRWDGFKAKVCKFFTLGSIYDFFLDLPRFRDGQETSYRLYVERAPNPKDICWQSLGTPAWKYVLLSSLSWLALGGVMCLTFWVCFSMAKLQDENKIGRTIEETGATVYSVSRIWSFLPAVVITLSGLLLQLVARTSGAWQSHISQSAELGTLVWKLAVALLINSGAVPFAAANFQVLDGDSGTDIVDWARNLWVGVFNGSFTGILREEGPFWRSIAGHPGQWYEQGGLADDMFFVILISAITTPIWVIFPYWWVNYFWLWRIDPESAEMWSYTLRGQRTSYVVSQEDFNSYHESVEPDPAWMYAEIVELYLVAVLYAPLLPVGLPIAAFGLFLFYWSAKYGLLRLWTSPELILGPQLAKKSLFMLKFVHCLGLPVTTCIFVTPSLTKEAQRDLYLSMWMMIITSLVFPMLLHLLLLLRRCRAAGRDQETDPDHSLCNDLDSDHDYYVMQKLWPPGRRYTKTHVLYRALPESVCPTFMERRLVRAEQGQGDLTDKIVATLLQTYTDAIDELKEARSCQALPCPLSKDRKPPLYRRKTF